MAGRGANPWGRRASEAGLALEEFHRVAESLNARKGGAEFKHVNIMAVAHGTDKGWLLEHKAAIDRHLKTVGIPVHFTNVFWDGRSEIKPSEISPPAYIQWRAEMAAQTALA